GFGHRGGSGEGGRGNHGHATTDEVGHERRQAIVFALQPVVLDHDVLALDVAGFVEGFAEGSAKAIGLLGRSGADKADDRHRSLLRAHRERPRCCHATEKRDELASPHWLRSQAEDRAYHNARKGASHCSEYGSLSPRWVILRLKSDVWTKSALP